MSRRVMRQVENFVDTDLSYTRFMMYDGDNLIGEANGNDKLVAVYLQGVGIDDPRMMLRDINNNGYFEDDEVFYYIKDHLGSVKELVNINGKMVQRYDYKSYGETKLEHHQGQEGREFIENPFAYTSREWDQDTGDYYYRARYYNPNTGRFTQKDPIGFNSGDSNFYRYADNNPVSKVDPEGLQAWGFNSDLTASPLGVSIVCILKPNICPCIRGDFKECQKRKKKKQKKHRIKQACNPLYQTCTPPKNRCERSTEFKFAL